MAKGKTTKRPIPKRHRPTGSGKNPDFFRRHIGGDDKQKFLNVSDTVPPPNPKPVPSKPKAK